MRLRQLKINNLRIIESASIAPGPALNLFEGHNGAGKTTILEALAILSRGRSFRSGPFGAQVGAAGDAYTLVCELESDGGTQHRLGIERSNSEWKARCDGRDIAQLTELSAMMPVVSMHPENYALVSGPPEMRRRYLDWGVFHVKHGFLEDWRRYTRALAQRNAALRQGASAAVLDSMTPILVSLGEKLHEARKSELEHVTDALDAVLPTLSDSLPGVSATYQPGWSENGFEEALTSRLALDRERGWTSVGPQRAELLLKANGRLVRDTFSRGEQKLLYVALNLAQAQRMAQAGHRPVLLIDDLASEFDAEHLQRVIDRCLAMECQVLVTGTDLSSFQAEHIRDAQVFNVKEGSVIAQQ